MTTARERFFEKVERDATTDCWNWTGTIDRGGYGKLKVDGKMERAHRFSFHTFNGAIPSGNVVLHKCDNPRCVNPSHLSVGTHADNVTDMFAKGRQPKRIGKNNGRAKLTDDDVRAIRKSSLTQSDLAARYGIARSQISMIKNRVSWEHVGDD